MSGSLVVDTISRRYRPTPKTFWKEKVFKTPLRAFQISERRATKASCCGLAMSQASRGTLCVDSGKIYMCGAHSGKWQRHGGRSAWIVVGCSFVRLPTWGWLTESMKSLLSKLSPRFSKSPLADLGSYAFRWCWIMLNQYCLWPFVMKALSHWASTHHWSGIGPTQLENATQLGHAPTQLKTRLSVWKTSNLQGTPSCFQKNHETATDVMQKHQLCTENGHTMIGWTSVCIWKTRTSIN